MPVVNDLTGVWDNPATSQACGGGCSTKAQSLRFPKRADILLRLKVVDEAGVAVDLSDPSTTITFTARRQAIGADVLFPPRLAIVTNGPNGEAQISIPGSDTASVEPGRYTFDLWMQLLGDNQPLVPVGALLIEPTLFQQAGTLPAGVPLIISPPVLPTIQHNYAPTNWLPAKIARLTPAVGGTLLTGLVSAGLVDPIKSLINLGPDDITVPHEHAGSIAANRFKLPPFAQPAFVIPEGGAVDVFYDVVDQRWRLV